MATLKHDAAGFLVGDPLDLGKAVSILETVQADVRAMRQALAGAPSSTPRAPSKIDRAPVTPMRHSGLSSSTFSKPEIAAAVNKQVAAMVQAASKQVAVPQGRTGATRDARGRFVGASSGLSGRVAQEAQWTGSSQLSSDGFVRRMAAAVKEEVSSAGDSDPTVKAYKEVAEPMKRGFITLLGAREDNKKGGWFRRIWGEIKGMRVEQTAYEKAAAKTLKAIEAKPVVAGTGGGSALPNLLSSLPNLSGAGSILGGMGGLFKIAAKGALRRIPLIGALLSGIGAASDIFDSERDDDLSRREKDKNAGRAIGGVGGTIGGMMAGAAAGAFAGPIGMVVGGVIGAFLGDQAGQIIGNVFGGWISDLRTADIPCGSDAAWDSVVAGFQEVYDSIGKKWDGFIDSAKSGFDTVTNLFRSAYEGLKSLPVIGKAIQAAEVIGNKASEAASTAAGAAKAKAVEVGSSVADGTKAGAKYLVENTTIGRGATWLAEVGKGYNIIQRADGTLEKREGARNWRNFNPGNIEAGVFATKHGAIGSDGRFAVFPDYETGRKAKEGLIFEGKNYRDKTLSAAIARYAPPSENNTKDYQAAILASVGGQNKRMAEYSPEERARIMDAMERMEGFKVGKVTTVGATSLGVSTTATSVPQIATIAIPRIPSMPSAPVIPDAPVIQVPLSSGDTGRNITVTPAPAEHGQDLSNRRMAHIVTGGYAGGS